MDCNDSKDKMEEKVDDENVEHVLERVYHTVEHSLELGNPLDGFQGPKYSQHSEGFYHTKIFSGRTSTDKK